MVNNLIKNMIPFESPYTHVAAKILRFTYDRNIISDTVVREMCKIETVFNLQLLKLLRFSFSFQVFRVLFTELTRTCYC